MTGYGWKEGKTRPIVSVAEATVLTGKSAGTIYRWIRLGKIKAEETTDGLELRTADVLAVAAKVRPGRPRVDSKET